MNIEDRKCPILGDIRRKLLTHPPNALLDRALTAVANIEMVRFR